MLQRYVRKKLGITSPSETGMSAGRAFIDGFQHVMAQPYTPPPPLTDAERAELEAKYPPYEITAENIGAVIIIVARYGYEITIKPAYNGGFLVMITASDGRHDGEDSDTIEDAFHYAFASFCNDHDGAMRREIATLP